MTTDLLSNSISAPKVFHVIPSSLNSTITNGYKCLLCNTSRKEFYCSECIKNGEITSAVSGKKYAVIYENFLQTEQLCRDMEQKCSTILEEEINIDVIETKIRQKRNRNKAILLALNEKKEKKLLLAAKLKDLQEKNHLKNEKLKAYKTKSESLETWVLKQYDSVVEHREKLKVIHEKSKKLIQQRIDQLFKYVFPVSIVKPNSNSEMESSEDSITKALAEASQTTFVKDKWVYTDYSQSIQYSVVAPRLPGTPNSLGYGSWASNQDALVIAEDPDAIDKNASYTISAALTYTAQLVNILAFFLDVLLPCKINYGDFSSTTINEQQFNRRVTRLNVNVLHLCFTQNIDISALNFNNTIYNLLQLKERNNNLPDSENLDHSQLLALEKSIPNDLKSSDNDSDSDGDLITHDWEAIPHIQCPESQAGCSTSPANLPTQSSLTNTQTNSVVAGGLVNSAFSGVASIWRGLTGR